MPEEKTGFISENTRKIRRGLMTSCLIGFSISQIGLYLREFSLFGSKFAITNHQAIPFILGIIVSYYLVTFLSYGFQEYSDVMKQFYKDKAQAELDSEASEVRAKATGMIRKSFFGRKWYLLRSFRFFTEIISPIFIGIFTAILLFAFTEIKAPPKAEENAPATTNEHTQLKETKSRLVRIIETLQPSEPDGIYVVTKAVRLRIGPATDYEILEVLQPNLYVKVFKKEKRWFYVKYFDYIDDETKEGWVYNRYLKKVLYN